MRWNQFSYSEKLAIIGIIVMIIGIIVAMIGIPFSGFLVPEIRNVFHLDHSTPTATSTTPLSPLPTPTHIPTSSTSDGTPQAKTPETLFNIVTHSTPTLTDQLSSQDANDWTQGPMPDVGGTVTAGGCGFTSGAYRSYVYNYGVIECIAQNMTPLSSSQILAFQVTVTFLQGDGGAGLLFCFQDHSHLYYRFVVRPSGYTDVYDPTTTDQPAIGAASHKGTHYTLTVIVYENKIYCYIDGSFIDTGPIEAKAVLGGTMGVFTVEGQNNPTVAAFQTLTVWTT